MEGEQTLGEIYDELQDKLSLARTHALMGERETALGLLRGASLEFARFRNVLTAFPGYYALEHAFTTTRCSLENEADRILDIEFPLVAAKPKRRTKKAA